MKKYFISLLVLSLSMVVAMGLWVPMGGTFDTSFQSLRVWVSGDSLPLLEANDRQIAEARTSVMMLSRFHYKGLPMNDSLSAIAFRNYVERMDPAKVYFTSSEIDSLESLYLDNIDDLVMGGDLQPLFDLYADYRKRALSFMAYHEKRLGQGFDFMRKEYFNADFRTRTWATDADMLKERWRKLLKNEVLAFKLLGKSDSAYVDVLSKRYRMMTSWLRRLDNEDAFQDLMTSIAEAYDPHSSYFSALTAANFDIEMSKSLEGIGAQLAQNLEYTTISSLVPGGPAYKSKQLAPADRIVAVAEGDTGQFVDIIGWRITEVVQLIRGKKGTVVRLLVLPADSPPDGLRKEVRIVRDRIHLKDAVASSKVYDIERDGKPFRLGVITLPSFYIDWKAAQRRERNYRSASRDVQHLLDSLKEISVDGIVLDLRRNGGGALSEAIQLTGLFIQNGPVVQVQDFSKRLIVHRDREPSIGYAGPLLLLVDRFTASASEIVAGALQDYDRSLIAGESTYGKGSVQNIFDLSDYLSTSSAESKKVGEIKLTFAQYYRVNGHSTQVKGVVPDLIFPSRFDSLEYREAEQPAALPWKAISPLSGRETGHTARVNAQVRRQLQERLHKDLKQPEWTPFIQQIARYQAGKEQRKRLPLNYEERKLIYDENQQEQQQRTEDPNEQNKKEEKDPLLKDHYLRQGLFMLADLSKKRSVRPPTKH